MMNDRLSLLPNDVIILILSFLTTKEVKRSSIVSKKWRRWLLGHYPKLNFQGSKEIFNLWFEIRDNDEELFKQRSEFIRVVDNAILQHSDSSIDEFRVAFDLDKTWQSSIDNWVEFALKKRVTTLKIDFTPVFDRLDPARPVLMSFKRQNPNNLASLFLNLVNITSEVVESILVSCPVLENLCIRKSEVLLTSIVSPVPVLSLKNLEVSFCDLLQKIDISAPKMVSFWYLGQPIELNIRDAVSLSSVFIGGGPGQEILYAFEPMYMYFSQLEVMSLRISVGCTFVPPYNLGVEHMELPLLGKLKVLDLCISGEHSLSLLGWTPLIEACPVLEKLTLKFIGTDYGYNRLIRKRNGSPLKSLKTLEMYGYCGRRIDIELATFVIENAINLEQVVVEVVNDVQRSYSQDEPKRIKELKEMIRDDVTFILTEYDSSLQFYVPYYSFESTGRGGE